MTIEIKKLTEPLPYDKIGNLLYNTYFTSYKEDGALHWNSKYAEIYFNAWVLPKSNELIFSAWDDDKLIGLAVGHKEIIKLDNEIEIIGTNIGLTAVDSQYRRNGIATNMVSNLIEEAKKLGYDLVFRMVQKGKYGDNILKKFDFVNISKHEHYIKIMEKYGVQILKEYRGLNPVLAKLAESLYSKLPHDPLDGTLRTGKIPDDISRCVEIINSYSSRVPLSRIYDNKTFQIDLENTKKLNDAFGDPWGLIWYILELNNKIMATMTCRIELTTFERGSAPVGLFGNLGFDESLTHEQKLGFIAEILRDIRKKYPEIFTCQITTFHHELKVFKDLKFTDDQSKYFLMVKPLTDKANEILNRYKKIKEFNLTYYR
ncbi:MAG: GNAT family N-acetyltransferase [Candidatus Helarchaeota archaeon]